MSDRRDIALHAVFNLRDLGGYPTGDGRRTRWRRLLRGAGLHRLEDRDLETVRALGLRTAIDLRTAGELQESGGYPSVLEADVRALPMVRATWGTGDIDPDEPAEHYLLRRYVEMLDEGRDTIRDVLGLLARPEAYPATFYCAAGKDRTGVLAGVLLDAIGVLPEHTIADYALSMERVARIVERARAAGHTEAESSMVSQPAAVMAAPAEAMRLLLDHLREEHGSTRGYLAGIGVDGATVDAVAEQLLEEGDTPGNAL